MAHTFDSLIVKVDSVHSDFARKGYGIHSKAVILRSDFYLSGLQIFHRLIGPAMAELKFESFASKSQAEKLVPKANSKDRNARLHQIADRTHCVIERGRVARAVRQEYSGRFVLQRFRCRCVGRHDLNFESILPQAPQN